MKPPVASLRLQKEFGLDRNKRKGASAVEFALVAPIFLMLVFGMIEFGRAIMVQQVVTNASREGARVAVLDGSTSAEVYDKVRKYLESASIPMNTAAKVSVVPDPPSSAGYGEPVSVSVSVPYSSISWVPGASHLKGVTLDATSVMRRETVQ